MPDQSTILSLPYILPSQAQKHVTHNEAIGLLDVIVQLAVKDRSRTVPPPGAVIGDRHIVAGGPTGAWAGQGQRIARYNGSGWEFIAPREGWCAFVVAEAALAYYDGIAWVSQSQSSVVFARLGVSAVPDATNRLSVSAPASLFSHAGAGHQVKVNKQAAADTASLLFQTGFSGRAEMGTTGSDDFAIKVSADGSTFFDAMVVERTSGKLRAMNGLGLTPAAGDPGSPANGDLWYNATTGKFRARQAGTAVDMIVSDGAKGDVTVSASGATWTIAAAAVTNAKLASVPTATIKGRITAATGVPEDLTAAQTRTVLNVADGATANSADAILLARANHTGTQLAATVSDFATAVAATAAVTANTAKVTNATHTGDVTGDTALTIAAAAVTNAKLANVGTATIKGRVAGGTGASTDLTATQATTLIDTFTSALKGAAPASGGGTANFLRADGTWAQSVSDGAKGDITVSASGTIFRVAPQIKVGLPLALAAQIFMN